MSGVTIDPDSIGAVRRSVHAEGVTLEVRGSRNALLVGIVLSILPLGAIVVFGVIAGQLAGAIFGGGANAYDLMFALGTVFAFTAAVCAATFNPLRRLLRTATRGMALTVDAHELRLHARGFFRDSEMRWPRVRIVDVLVRYRQAAIYELHIVSTDRPPTVLLYGASEAELEFLASELRRASGVDRLLRAAAGAWGDQVDDAADPIVAAHAAQAAPPPALSSQPLLQYAPESNDDIIRHRGAGSVRLLVPPLLSSQVLRANRWFVVLFAILAVAVVEPYVFGNLRFVVKPMMILIVPVMGFCAGIVGWHMLKCLRHTSIDATADDLMLTVRWPIVGRITTRWPVDAVRGVRAVDHKPPRVEFCLRSGRRQTLAFLPTFAEAADLAAQLQRAQVRPLTLAFPASPPQPPPSPVVSEPAAAAPPPAAEPAPPNPPQPAQPAAAAGVTAVLVATSPPPAHPAISA